MSPAIRGKACVSARDMIDMLWSTRDRYQSATDGTVGASRRAGGRPEGMDDAINLLTSSSLQQSE